EVFQALDEFGLSEQKYKVKEWYDGFIFGECRDIYNPWSILNFLDKREFTTYWANTSSNSLAGKLIREGDRGIKSKFESLLRGEAIRIPIDEQVAYNQLNGNSEAVFSLLLASGYLKVLSYDRMDLLDYLEEQNYELALTNYEVKRMFVGMVRGWFADAKADYNDFMKALLSDDIKAMNIYMNRLSLEIFSYFDTARASKRDEPESFYHGFVLGLLVDLQDRYILTSNRESGFGRYDVMLEPRNPEEYDAIILEFKVCYEGEKLEDTVYDALKQIQEKEYMANLIARGIKREHIRCYGFAFQGKKVLIGK
ncbi:MAG: PD-(D/E)XK nuclease domain-containing protein, partial [Bariatricus sp.]